LREPYRSEARRDVAAGLRTIYTAVDADTAFDALAAFSASPLGQPDGRRAGAPAPPPLQGLPGDLQLCCHLIEGQQLIRVAGHDPSASATNRPLT
jgi:hypothetical protein